jgi:4-diphosphocytidyl-2-C-methyl-D-erythritol kinase
MTNEPPDLPAGTVEVWAPAKINLFLRVLGLREDGYHELETLVAPISLADRLEIHAVADPAQFRTLSIQLTVTGDPALIRGVPVDESNLAFRAAAALADRASPKGFAEILLDKRVPSAAGLGGGSSDAAATLRVLNRMWGCGLDEEALLEVGASIGSDVPALLLAAERVGTLARGRGELVKPFRLPPMRWALLTLPFGVRTADAFRWWDEDGGATGPDPAAVLRAAEGGPAEELGGLLFNDLEGPVARRHPVIGEAKRRLMEAGSVAAVMCGSGPSVAGLLPAAGDTAIPGAVAATSPASAGWAG